MIHRTNIRLLYMQFGLSYFVWAEFVEQWKFMFGELRHVWLRLIL